jgi:hypothetical protein
MIEHEGSSLLMWKGGGGWEKTKSSCGFFVFFAGINYPRKEQQIRTHKKSRAYK